MLIRSNTLNETEATSRSKLFNESVTPVPIPTTTNSAPLASSNTCKPPQNRYETLFIKLFAKTTLQLIMSFTSIFFSIIIIRDFIGKFLDCNVNINCL